MKLFNGIKIFDHSLYVKDYLRSKNLVGHNDIINGCLRFWQRGTSFSNIQTSKYTADRFVAAVDGAESDEIQITRDTSTPSNDFSYSLKAKVTTADTTLGANDYAGIYQAIEGYNFRKYAGKYGTLSFWVKSSKTGTFCVGFRNKDYDRSYVVEYQINTTDTWEYKTITVLFNADGTWYYDNNVGMMIYFTLKAGSNLQMTPNVWYSGNAVGTSNQVNWMDDLNETFYLAGIKFELGQIATPFIANDYGTELARCQRYYEKSYNHDHYPGDDVNSGLYYCSANSNGGVRETVIFHTGKRDNPTITTYSDAETKDKITYSGGDVTPTINYEGEHNFGLYYGGATAHCKVAFHWIADAEL